MRIPLVVLAVILAYGTSMDGKHSAYGATIILTFNNTPKYFDPNGVDRTADLVQIMVAARDIWQEIIKDSSTLNVTYQWGDLSGTNIGFDSWSWPAGSNRPDTATITFDTKIGTGGAARRWYFDESPRNDSEYAMTQTLYRDLASANQSGGTSAWFKGGVPDVFEAAYSGVALGNAPADAQLGLDLLSVALHELGHALGVSGSGNGLSDGDYDIQPSQVRGATMAILPDSGGGHLAISNSNMFPSIGAGTRDMPSAADVLAAASTSVWTNVDLPRKDFIAAASNNSWIAANWMGNQVPDAADDAFIRSQDFNPTVELVAPSFARNLFVGDGDQLSTNAFKLDITDTLTIDGLQTWAYADPGGEVEADAIIVRNGAILLANGLVDTRTMTIDGDSSLYGAGGTVAISQSLVNDGTIYATGGTLLISGVGTTWDFDGTNGNGFLSAVAGNLAIDILSPLADTFNGTIVVGQGRWFASSQPFVLASGAEVHLNGGTTAGAEANLNVALTLESSTATIDVSGLAKNHYVFNMLNGNVNLASGAILELLGETVVSGGAFNVATSGARLRFQSDTQLSGGTFSTTGTGAVEFNGATEYAGGTLQIVGRVHQNGNATVSAPTTIGGTGTLDLDGTGGSAVWNVNNDLTLNVARIEYDSNHILDGRINLNGSGTTMTVNTPIAWTMGGRLDIDDGAVLAGSAQMNVTGSVYAESGRIDAPVAFKSGSSVAVVLGDVLQLDGTTYYEGGVYSGGTLHQDGTAHVLATTTLGTNFFITPPVAGPPPTPLWLEKFNWDGTVGASAVTNISPGVTFTINAVEIDDNPSTDGYDGTVNINGGTLIVNTGVRITYSGPPNTALPANVAPTAWRLDGTMNLQASGGNTAVAASQYGSPLQIYGTVNALGGNAAIAGMAVTLAPSGRINVWGGANLNLGLVAQGTIDVRPSGLLRLNATSTLQSTVQMIVDGAAELASSTTFQGGSYEGAGVLRQLGNANFTETTLLEVPAEFAAGGTNTLAAGKELQLAGGGRIEAGAVFQGTGRLRNLANSALTLAQGAIVNVSFTNEGILIPGASPGSARVNAFSQAANGVLEIELSGSGGVPGVHFDQLVVDNTANLGGTLDVSLINSFVPGHNSQFPILTFDARSGDFAAYHGLNVGPRLSLVRQFTETSLILTAVQGGSGTWGVDQNGNASVPGNWTGAIPNGIGDVATFGPVITKNRTVTIDTPTVYGGMVFNDNNRYTIAGSQTLTLNATGNSTEIQVLNASTAGHLISAPLKLLQALRITNSSAGSLILSGPVDNTLGKKLTVGGSGGATLIGSQNHGLGAVLEILANGPATVNLYSDGGPNLAIANDGILSVSANNSILQITGGGETKVFGSSSLTATQIVQNALTIGLSAQANASSFTGDGLAGDNSVPEPSTLALLVLGALALPAYGWRRKKKSPRTRRAEFRVGR
ncbi:MAG: PEP-CTERM sorting domain-containing protein [Pirellulales bacterium]|nr:PEP-CTERM sorting domain-containing protein [Pirellulales bacterium]